MLELNHVSVHFSSDSIIGAVEDVTMSLQPRSKNVLIGETGSGKSVLILAILRLLPLSASISGAISFEGKDLLSLSEKELQKIRGARIAYIPQGSGNGMNPLLKVGFQIGEPLREHKHYSQKQALKESVHLLKQFGIGDEEKAIQYYPHMFSGGMRQRAMVAMGISAGADIILADEPTKGLDYSRVGMVADCFCGLENKTLLCVTHDITFAQRVGENITVMYAAQQLETADNKEFFSHPLHPYSRAILAAMPENGLQCNLGFAPAHDSYIEHGCRFADRCPHKMERCAQTPPMIEQNGHKVRCWLYAD